MKFNYTTIFFIAITVITIIFSFLLITKKQKSIINPEIVKHFKLHKLDLNQIESAHDLLMWLDQEEKGLWQELEKEIGLSYMLCQRLKRESLNDYLDDLEIVKENYALQEPLSQETITCIQSVMKDFSVDPDKIKIMAWSIGSAAAATDEILFVNEKDFKKIDQKAQKFVIGHELIHFIHKDHSTNFLVKLYTKNKNLRSDSAVDKLTRFQEMRADILSSLKNTEYAHGNILFFNEHIKSTGSTYGPPCHPKNSLRLEIGTKIASLSKKTNVLV